jgi:hypothetical protein
MKEDLVYLSVSFNNISIDAADVLADKIKEASRALGILEMSLYITDSIEAEDE